MPKEKKVTTNSDDPERAHIYSISRKAHTHTHTNTHTHTHNS